MQLLIRCQKHGTGERLNKWRQLSDINGLFS